MNFLRQQKCWYKFRAWSVSVFSAERKACTDTGFRSFAGDTRVFCYTGSCLFWLISMSLPNVWNRKLRPNQIRDITLILYNSVERSPWKAGNSSVTEKNSLRFMKLEGSLSCPQQLATWSYLGKNIPVHALPSSFCQIHFNIILPSTPFSFMSSQFFRLPHQNHAHTSLVSHNCHLLRFSCFLWCSHLLNISGRVKIMKAFIMQFSTVLCYFFPFGLKYPS